MGQCTAKSKRSEEQCKNWAIRKKLTCRFHGGQSTGPRTKEGKKKSKLVHIKHGFRTKENIQKMKLMRDMIRKAINILHDFKN